MTQIKPYKNKDNVTRYYFNAYVGRNPKTGKNVYRKRQGFKTKKHAQIALAELLKEIEANGLDNQKPVTTFSELHDLWIKQHDMNVKESTIETLNSFIRTQIMPKFGDMKLTEISVIYCQEVLNEWYSEGLSSYKQLRTITAQIMRYGESMEIMHSNPMAKTILPRKKEIETKLKYFDKKQLEAFFEIVEESGNYKQLAFFRVLAFTGARKAEILALEWDDIDLFNKSITIGKTLARGKGGKLVIQSPKTKSGNRTISIDDKTVKILSTWQSYQRQDYLKMGFNTTQKKQLVFSNRKNEYLYTTLINKWLREIIANSELPTITPHHFRHTHASLLLQSGVPIKEVSERLGHKDIRVTLEIYSHVMPEEAEKTAEKFANFVGF